MTKFQDFVPDGVIPATLLILNSDRSINDAATQRHTKDCALVEGVSAVTVNGHASEIHACTFDEQRQILDGTMDQLGDVCPVINGVYADGSQEAARIAKMAERSGASALLIFPPNSMAMGGQLRPEMALEHFKQIANVTDLPLICFQYPMSTGLGYPFDTLLKLFEVVPTIRAIKDWSNDPMLHERHIKTFQALDKPVNVLTTHSSWLMASLCMGAKGLLSGAGSVIVDLQVQLFVAIQNKNMELAQKINERIYPLVQSFYAHPFLDMHNRMKEALVMLGRIGEAHVRPPLMKLSDDELANLEQAIEASRIKTEFEKSK